MEGKKKKKSNNTYAERMGTNTDSYTEKQKSQLQQKKKVQEQNKRDRFLFYHFFISFIIVRQETDKYSAISRKNKSTSKETKFKYNDWNISETTKRRSRLVNITKWRTFKEIHNLFF